MTRRRWSDNDKRCGPLTYSRDTYGKTWSLVLDSGESEYPGCSLRLRGFGYTLILDVPPVLRPAREWVKTSHYAWSTNPAGGYFNEHHRQYGFSLSGGFLQLFYGAQTHDSRTDQNWCKTLPWTDWRFVRQSWYGPAGESLGTLWETTSREVREAQWEWRQEFEAALVKPSFAIVDYDGEHITAATQIEEREWRFGAGLFAWLSVFRRPRVSRSLSIEFSKEVGPEKGSWKGGTLGHGIEMLPGELHESALRRYCEQEHCSKGRTFKIAFAGAVQ